MTSKKNKLTEPTMNVIKMAALGRPVYLGQLYDAIKDSFVDDREYQLPSYQGPTLDDNLHSRRSSIRSLTSEIPSEASFETISHEVSLQIDVLSFEQGAFTSKLSHMDLCPNMKIALAANPTYNSRGAVRYALHSSVYKYDDEPDVTQAVKTLRIRLSSHNSKLQQDEIKEFKKSKRLEENTHMVVGIDYGLEAYCLFVRPLKENESKEDAEEELESFLNCYFVDPLTDRVIIPEFPEHGCIKVRFYGDLHPHPRDCSVQQTYDIIRKMIESLDNDPNLAKPVNIRLESLSETNIPVEIDQELADECLRTLNGMIEHVSKVRTWLQQQDENVKTFTHHLRQSLRHFVECLIGYIKLFRAKLGSLLPNLRSGKEDAVDAIQSLLETVSEGLFSLEKQNRWIENKDKEKEIMTTIANLAKQNKGAVFIQSKTRLDEALFNLGIKWTLVLVLPSMSTDYYLKSMQEYVRDHRQIVRSHSIDYQELTPWHASETVRTELLSLVRRMLQQSTINQEDEQTTLVQFLMVSTDLLGHEENPTYNPKLILYKDGQVFLTDMRLPSAPHDVKLKSNVPECQSFILEWRCDKMEDVTHFLVQQKNPSDDNENYWTSFLTKSASTNLEIQTKQGSLFNFEFRVAAFTLVGRSHFSSIFRVGDNQMIAKSSTPLKIEEKKNSNKLERNQISNQQSKPTTSTIPQQPVRPVINRARSNLVQNLVEKCQKIQSKPLDIYALPLIQIPTVDPTKFRRFEFGHPKLGQGPAQHKTILVMGATGSGKTTLINSMINFILGVEWEDPFRFQMIIEKEDLTQAFSQTTAISAYQIHHMDGFRIPYSLTIVDTPGYGDTRGIDRDRAITANIEEFFKDSNGIQEVDAIGFISQASLPRLTTSQTYIFDSVLSVFGKDIQENIQLLLTFADSQKPPVLAAIKEAKIPCTLDQNGQPQHHQFNNSAFFVSPKSAKCRWHVGQTTNFNQMFWNLGMENFRKFFARLSVMITQSLNLTRQVLDERKRLEVTLEGLQPKIGQGLAKMEELRKIRQLINNNQAQIDANVDFEFEVEVSVPKKIDIEMTGHYLTNCQTCHVTCHYPCGIARDDQKKNCVAMDNEGMCRICPNKCVWSVHSNQTYRWEYVLEKQKSSSEEVRKKYQDLLQRRLTAQELTVVLKGELKTIRTSVLELVKEAAKCIRRLEEIALRPSPCSTPQYIDMMINSEEQEKRPGYMQRIESLKKVRQLSELQQKICQGEAVVDDLDNTMNSTMDEKAEDSQSSFNLSSQFDSLFM